MYLAMNNNVKLKILIPCIVALLILTCLTGCIEDNKTNNNIQPNQNSTNAKPVKKGNYTNENMSTLLRLEAEALKDKFLSPIYPAPKPVPEKLNSVFLPLPSQWPEALRRVDELKAMGINSVQFGPLMNIDENDHPYSVGDDLVKFYINEFHRTGMHVILTTNPAGAWNEFTSNESWGRDWGWSNNVIERRKNGTFTDEYIQEIYTWAETAKEYDVAAFIPANEIQMITTNHSYIQKKSSEILPELRKRYDGKIGFNIQGYADGYYEYNLTNYDFIMLMGRQARVCDLNTRSLCKDHIRSGFNSDIDYLNNLSQTYHIDGIWFEFDMFSTNGTWWEPQNNNPYTHLNPDEASAYIDIVLDEVYDNLSGISIGYYPGLILFDEPIPTTLVKYFMVYNQQEQSEKTWEEKDLYTLAESFFPEWDTFLTSWGYKTLPEDYANLTSNEKINISGTATYVYPEKIEITKFTFNGTGRDIEIRLANDLTGELLVCIARLMRINESYENANLTLFWPEILEERTFNYILIFDVDDREVLGRYVFQKP